MKRLKTMALQSERSYPTPDDNEIRELLHLDNGLGNLAHGVLPAGHVPVAQRHKTVGEIWYFLQGLGQVWRKRVRGEQLEEQTVYVGPGRCLAIETEAHFQFPEHRSRTAYLHHRHYSELAGAG